MLGRGLSVALLLCLLVHATASPVLSQEPQLTPLKDRVAEGVTAAIAAAVPAVGPLVAAIMAVVKPKEKEKDELEKQLREELDKKLEEAKKALANEMSKEFKEKVKPLRHLSGQVATVSLFVQPSATALRKVFEIEALLTQHAEPTKDEWALVKAKWKALETAWKQIPSTTVVKNTVTNEFIRTELEKLLDLQVELAEIESLVTSGASPAVVLAQLQPVKGVLTGITAVADIQVEALSRDLSALSEWANNAQGPEGEIKDPLQVRMEETSEFVSALSVD